MTETDVIIVGGGPAGSSCAWMLKRLGVECIVLDKATFPRLKLCAGWITPQVVHQLEISEYPHGILTFDRFRIAFKGRRINLRTRQYSIRRVEFDSWLLKRSAAPVHEHDVRDISPEREGYTIDGRYRCRFLVGAGGTHCPVYRTLFRQLSPRVPEERIAAIEEEFSSDYSDADCRLWFCENRLPGYSWYVPKTDGVINVGIGGLFSRLKSRGSNILQHWGKFTGKLAAEGLVKGHEFGRQGWNYYRRSRVTNTWLPNACIVGDAAGLATRDLGEGIGPAIESGLLAARAIKKGRPANYSRIAKYSLPWMVLAGLGIYPGHGNG